ncbi:MAG: EAL domain-containing protein [Rhodospirillales bacterium]|nr:EAL domain-containing protein [Rhodospirillales bacterium]
MTALAARGRDADAREASWRNAVSALLVAEDRLGEVAMDFASGDSVYLNLHQRFDATWATNQLSLAPHTIYGIDHVFIFGPDNDPLFASHRAPDGAYGTATGPSLYETLAPLILGARAAAKDRRAVWPVRLYDRVHLAAAAVIQPQGPRAANRGGEGCVLVFVRDFSPQFLARVAGGNGLSDLRVASTDNAGAGELSLALQSGGEPHAIVGFLIWQPNLPGYAMFHAMIIPLLGTALLMFALLALVLTWAKRAGSALDAAASALRRSRATLEMQVEERTADLREAEERYRSIVENAVEGIFQMALDGSLISANPAMARILGYANPDVLIAAARPDVMLKAASREAFDRVVNTFGEVIDFVSEVCRPDGTKTWISQNTRAVRGAGGAVAYYEGMAIDISARRTAEENLIKNAFHDALTGLPNRFLFFERLSQLMARGERSAEAVFAVLFLDFDRFKLINDSYGHLVGDNLLIAMSQRLSQRLRPADTLARLGGDEFAILIEGGVMPASALALAERLHEACHEPMDLNGRDIFVSLSIGVAWARSGGYADADAVLRDADIAMYQAKDRGRSTTVLFEPGMHQAVVSRLEIETQLRHALDRGEFVVHYQPIVTLKNQRIAGFEALVRWNHPSRGLVPPSEFIPTAEETGMIVPIGDWVLREACTFAASWRRRYGGVCEHLFMSVNVSAAQLEQEDAVERVARALNETGLPGPNLKLEITESIMMSNPIEVHRTLSGIADLGARLCIDDFGTGYSSLSHLHTFPVSVLKIDRAFTSRLMAGREHVEMARTILLLGKNMDLSVIAEGIETAMQCDWMRSAGCDYGQGYFFGAPVDYCSASALLAADLNDGALAI